MAKFKSFAQMALSIEEDELLESSAAEGGMDVTDVVETQDVQDEIAADSAVIDEAQLQVEEALDAADELEEQAEVSEQVLEESPEKVTEEVVQVAQEAYQFILARLGHSIDEIRSSSISHESMVASPVESLRLTTEAVKDTLAKIKDTIILIIKKVISWISNLFTKVKIFLANTEKAAIALEKKVKEAKNLKFSDTEKLAGSVKPIAGLVAATGGDFKPSDIAYYAKVGVVPALVAVAENVVKGGEINAHALDALAKNPIYKKVQEAVKVEDGARPYPLAVGGSDIKYVAIAEGAIKNGSYNIKELVKGASAAMKAAAPKSQADILEYVKAAKILGSGAKAYFDGTRKDLDRGMNIAKELDKANEAGGKKAQRVFAALTGSANASVSQYLRLAKGTLSVANSAFKIASGSKAAGVEEPKAESASKEVVPAKA